MTGGLRNFHFFSAAGSLAVLSEVSDNHVTAVQAARKNHIKSGRNLVSQARRQPPYEFADSSGPTPPMPGSGQQRRHRLALPVYSVVTFHPVAHDLDLEAALQQPSHLVRNESFREKWEFAHDKAHAHRPPARLGLGQTPKRSASRKP
ncbi:hypothetical protein [Mesorhizobium sp. M4B.F.Ca.ET.017.02.2.1]|uniref:hypothetical protein n=1 Tax=Mesorhizobium sp. M4B.F.Ca.ET.017.02.2.1 TaxID=2496649 RepID=UPI001FDFA5A3|nr:hypothetical protein [Mesorhizobium sp. M4B.F.Ca.ET.017.02.2.1]